MPPRTSPYKKKGPASRSLVVRIGLPLLTWRAECVCSSNARAWYNLERSTRMHPTMTPALKPLDRELEIALRRVFGFPNLRAGQEDVIRSVMDGHDTLAVMPTGAGKSLCYQLPALQFEGMTIIVSPLISLMRDQATKLTEAGIANAVLNSALSASELHDAMDALSRH